MCEAHAFAMASGDITGTQMADRLLANQRAIFRWAQKTGPFVASVATDKLMRVRLCYP